METPRPRRHARALVATLAAVVLGGTGGCSLIFVDRAKTPSATEPRGWTCTASNTLPVVDGLLAGWFAVNAVVNASKDDDQFQGGAGTKEAAVSLGLSLTTAMVGSAIYGARAVSECRRVLEEEGPPRRRPRIILPPPSPMMPQPPMAGAPDAGVGEARDGGASDGAPPPAPPVPQIFDGEDP